MPTTLESVAAERLTDAQWEQYERDGYLRLGKVLSDEDLAALQQRIDDIMLGKADVPYERLLMQLDSTTGKYEDAGVQSRGHKGATLAYRKIQELEYDPLFLEYTERPLFKDICARTYGPETPVASFRAMFMNKPARQGTWLPWHQDRWTHLDRDPKITVWTALDPATIGNGCVQVIVGSHKSGLINPSHGSGFLTEEQAAEFAPKEKVVFLELEPGEAVLLHNYLLHASDVNHTDVSRRAFSVCYMDANTEVNGGGTYFRLWDR
ncbi:MAG TPA: phytanoyl-CoA dioxygenase family protein [Armatimonadaceae bacterium]|nr:phytanoyl-CoA dioxygenase family protein [Armatimonadaceae bacterium]